MTSDQPTYVLQPPKGRLGEPPKPSEPSDPLAKITLTPRRFAAVLAGAGMLLGLILALVPVHVASLDDAEATSVSCGNTIGGVETPLLADGLGNDEPSVLATYVGTCQDAIGTRLLFAWPMFFAGMIGIAWLGVVRRDPLPDKLSGVEHA
jgi:hypothetical protein